MKKITYPLFGLALAVLSSISIAEPYRPLYALSKEYTITTFAKYIKNIKGNKQVKYDFILDNRSDNSVYSFTLGHESIERYDLGVSAIPFSERDSIPFTAPANWVGSYRETARYDEATDEEILLLFYWRINNSLSDNHTQYVIPARTKQIGFGFVSNKKLPLLATSFAELSTSRNKWVNGEFEYEMIQLTKGDTVKPTGSVSATVSATPAKAGLYTATIKVTAKDNYDPLPEIVLTAVKEISSGAAASPFSASSYTVNTPNNATTGAYPTAITFKADANFAKRYQLLYAITDASDNKTEVSTTITIPSVVAKR